MKTTIAVEGMSCEHCVAHVSNALKAVPGVRHVSVQIYYKKAVVLHDDSLDIEALRAAVIDAGFESPATPVSG
jgi:copper chaperone CopZ